ncbi:Fibronectin type III-like domain-containing protein [Artemisia annua]|uniref:Fibronectin type III-like domain-containing protein n=1 Tax=Artemisia annua TaxID=35608 RepID=A0A2U1NTZ5_ARTAN|nr:Fibronectin type III-like domain-containing protein [Artemisia annua]
MCYTLYSNATKAMIGNYAGVPCKYTSPLKGLSDYVRTFYEKGCDKKCNSTLKFKNAKKLVAEADGVVLVMGTYLSIKVEALDRTEIDLPGQQNLLFLEVAYAAKGPVILVIMSRGGMDIEFAKCHPKITSILWIGIPGQEGGGALADIIFGRSNPCGRLPITWYPRSYVDLVPMTNTNMRPNPTTGQPGQTYRFYRGKTICSFGFGLSHSSYIYKLIKASNLVSIPLNQARSCCSSSCNAIDVADSFCNGLVFYVDIMVTNTGMMARSKSLSVAVLFSSYGLQRTRKKSWLISRRFGWRHDRNLC